MAPFRPAKRPGIPPTLRGARELRGTVVRRVYASEDGTFQVMRFQAAGAEEMVTIAGNLASVAPGESLHVKGEWREHPQHGATFQVESYVPELPSDPAMVAAYLGSGLVKGVGPRLAERIAEHFGTEIFDILEHAPERLREVSGLGRSKAEAVTAAWNEHQQSRDVMMFLHAHGLTAALARRLFRHYGNEAAAVLRTNPYRAGLEVHGIGFHTADRIAAGVGIARDAPERLVAGLHHLLTRASDEGHTFLPREALLERGVEMLECESPALEAALAGELAARGAIVGEVLPEGQDAIFIKSLHKAESACARLLARLHASARAVVPGDATPMLDAFESKFRFHLAQRQRDAVLSALRGGISVVTGGPGTGKTTLVRALLHVVREHGSVTWALASPTGRAAQRLAETTRSEASTIHRLLKWVPQKGRFAHGPGNPVPAGLLIVDESSMLDVALAHELLGALAPGTAVVFVGDVDQLPSVGPGNFLRDMIESGRFPVTRLDAIFRQAGQSSIIVNSHRVNAGQMPIQPDPESDDAKDFFIIRRDDPESLREALLEMLTTRIPRKFGLDAVDDVQVLAPMRRGDLGTQELNRLLQDTLNPGASALRFGATELRVSDKVIQTSNNYDLDVFNGDVGRITSVSPENQTLRVAFGRRIVEYTWDQADQLQLAYAITIHKSQGSEYPAVIVLLHTQHYMMLKRNLLYTALTRGKKLVVLIGNARATGIAVRTQTVGERYSALRQWLVRPPAAEELF